MIVKDTVKPRKKVDKGRAVFIATILALPLLNFLVFYLYVNFNAFAMAFQRPVYGEMAGDVHWTLENFQSLFNTFGNAGGGVLVESLLNTLMYYCVGIFLGLPVSVLMCYFIYKKIRGYKLFRVMMYIPNIITATALAELFRYAVGTGGILDAIVTANGGEFFYIFGREGWANAGLLFYSFMFGFGTNMIVIGGAMNSMNTEMLEAAAIDGCNWFRELIYIIVPTIRPTIGTIVLLATAGLLSSTGPVLLFTKGDFGTNTLSFYVFSLVSGQGNTQDLYLASAVGLLMTAISFPLALVVKNVVYGKDD